MLKKSISLLSITIPFVFFSILIVLLSGSRLPDLFSIGQGGNVNDRLKDTVCATMDVYKNMIRENRNYEKNLSELEEFTKNWVKKHKPGDRTVAKIPVVVHIIWNTEVQNISNAVVQSQIDVLNSDYRKMNADTANIPPCFIHLGADTQIEFVLAKRDPSGNPTNGITRTKTPIAVFIPNDNMKFDSLGGHNIWDRDRYLNIWVCYLSGVLGYSQFPGGDASTDGNVIKYTSFGTIGPAVPSSAKGRTTTHEIGHWFNLRHVWGDDNCGDDLVEDTPTQESYNLACPIFPHITCGNGPNGDMYMNYMDYTLDNCANIFTIGQSNRMNACLGSIRSSLLSSNGGEPVSGTPMAHFRSEKTKINLGESVQFFDESGGIPTNWEWEFGKGNPSSSNEKNPVIKYNNPGVHTVKLKVTNSNGSDSVVFTDYMKVQGVAMSYFSIVYPPESTVIDTRLHNRNFIFTWQKPSQHSTIRYKWKVRKADTYDEISYYSDNGGMDSVITLRRGFLDTLARVFGRNTDTVSCIWRVYAYNGTDSLSSQNQNLFYIVRNVLTGAKVISSSIPDEFGLFQNYPNPFNPLTVIRFTIPKSEQVKISVYDLTGRELKNLVNEKKPAGIYEISFNAGLLSSGIYFYRMQSGDFTEVRRMVLIK